jgi:hypothetical protein
MSTLGHDAFQRHDGSVILNSGQVIERVHAADACKGDVCPIHKPTDHKLRGEQLFFNGRHMIRRIGTELKIDPDDYFYLIEGVAILRNSATCGNCGDMIKSVHRHDFVQCSCKSIGVDGGVTYLRHINPNSEYFIDTSVMVEITDD